MALNRLAYDLEKLTARTEAFTAAVAPALAILSDKTVDAAQAREKAILMVLTAIEMRQDLEAHCQGLALAVRHLALLPGIPSAETYDEIWALYVPELANTHSPGKSARTSAN